MHTSLLNIENLHVAYGSIEVLHGVSLHIESGEIVTLIGSNGAGKTSLLQSIFAAPRSHRGSINFAGRAITHLETHEIARTGLAIIPEGRRIFPAMTVYENIVMGVQGLGKTPDAALLREIYQMFPILEQRSDQRAGTLSGGEQQMLAIGRGLMAKPRLLMLDEPSLGLAPLIVKQIFAVLEEIRKRGVTLFLVEQNAHLALHLADRAYVLANGRITQEGRGKDLLNDPEVKKAYLGI
ncbi:MAG: ABC transporter ATP-binding protein [Oligoflexales bacterium]|nr:ABC transporter ATP-binding protein [Oligoflexales bacterium]